MNEIRKTKPVIEKLSAYWLLLFTGLLCAVFGFMEPSFATVNNILDIMRSSAIFCIASVGVCMVMITGEIDFSCGMELTAAACTVGLVLDSVTFHNYYLAVLLALAVCALFGLINGFLNVKVGIPGFLATMGTSLATQGIFKGFLNSTTLHSTKWPAVFTRLGQGRLGSIPYAAILMLVIVVVFFVITEHTPFGKRLYAVGANMKGCQYVGINSSSVKIIAFVLSAVLCGVAGLINASQLNSVSPYLGDSLIINVLTCLMLGAAVYKIGTFNIPGTLLGALLVSIINNGLTLLGAGTATKFITQGIVMLSAVTLVTVIRKRTTAKA